jgi:signal transduction histidine kinase
MAEKNSNSWLSLLTGLSGKVLFLTIIFVMLGEVLIFLPSIANFRIQWLKTRIAQAEIAALAAEAAPNQIVDAELRSTILKGAGVNAVSLTRGAKRQLMLRGSDEGMIDEAFDLRPGMYYTTIGEAFAVMFRQKDRFVSVIDKPPAMSGDTIEISLHEWPLRDAMLRYGLNILALSIVLSLIVATMIFAALNRVLVKPMKRLSANMMAFGDRPEDPTRVIVPSQRNDEIGIAENELHSMQTQLRGSLQQKTHLAALGLAVSKVSHDLRNMLTSAQLISDRLSEVRDPTVQRFAPKLISSLDRAILFLNQTITYGRAQELPPRRETLRLIEVVNEVFEVIALMAGSTVKLSNQVQALTTIDADHEHLIRILTNLARNAVQALDTRRGVGDEVRIAATRQGNITIITVSDNGPGIPPAVRNKVFEAFQTSARAGGTGLGLAISAELTQAHGGSICVLESSELGTVFEITIPDRVEELHGHAKRMSKIMNV